VLSRIQTLLNLRNEDRRKVWIMGTIFFLAGISEMMNYTSFMAIFNSRVGTQYLPMMYLFEAFLLPLEGWALSYFSQRMSKPRFMTVMYIFFVSVGLVNGLVLLSYQYGNVTWTGYYVILFLTSNFVIRQQTLLMWSTAFDLCPTQQAKRLMPVFVLFAIFGGIVAGVLSNLLAPLLGPAILYFVAAFILLSGLPNFISALKKYLIPLTLKMNQEEVTDTGSSSVSYYMKETFRSPFLLTVIGIMTLMPAVYFLMEYQYFTSAQAVFTNEAELTSFYGLMVIILFCAAFILQLFAAKLIDWLGASNTILAISALFLCAFGLVSLFIGGEAALIAVSAGYCVTYLLLYYFAEPSYQFFFKMLPLKHRDGFRYTAQGIAASAGILLGSAVSMLHSEAGVSLSWQAIIGTGIAAVLLVLCWLDRHLYMKELVRYLQVGSSKVKDFISEFIESMKNERVRRALLEQLHHPDETVQTVVLDLYQANPDPAASDALLSYAQSCTGYMRARALAAVHPSGWRLMAAGEREGWIRDEDAAVRAAAFRKLFEVSASEADRRGWIRTARSDSSIAVQAEAIRAMTESEELDTDLRRLLNARGEAALLACDIIGARGLQSYFYDVMMCLLEPTPVLKIAAVRAIGRIGGREAATSLTELLIGADQELRHAIELALIDIGAEALPELIRFISSPNDDIWRTTVRVVNAIGSEQDIRDVIVPSCVKKLLELSANQAFVNSIQGMKQERWVELARLRSDELTRSLLDTIWTVMVRFGDERTIPQIRRAVESRDEEVRDHGLEILSEGLGNARLTAALLEFYVKRTAPPIESNDPAMTEAAVSDPWLQAIAIRAGAAEGASDLVNNWEYLSALDKIVFLKQVPLFKEISIEELGRVASIANEKVYEEGQFLIRQGEPSDSLIVIVEGHIELSGKNADGVEGTIGVAGPMQSVGEAGLFDDRPSLVSAQVILEGAVVLEIEGSEATRLVRLYPDIGIGLLRSISHRLRAMEHLVLKLG
jgi:hypothetical protein